MTPDGGADYVTDEGRVSGTGGTSPDAPAQPTDTHPSFMGELAQMFTRIGRVLSDPDVQRAGNDFYRVLTQTADRELPGTRRFELLERTDDAAGG